MAQVANTKAALISSDEYMRATTKIRQRLYPTQQYVDGGQISFELPRAGFANMLWLFVKGTVTFGGTITGGTFNTRAPYTFIKKMQFGNNSATYMHDHSGWSWYKWATVRHGMDFTSNPTNGNYKQQSLQVLNMNTSHPIVPGANVAAQTYTYTIALPLMLSYNYMGDTGLVPLQNQAIYTLNLQLGSWLGGLGPTGGTSDLVTGLTGSSITFSTTATISCDLETTQAFNPAEVDMSNLINLFVRVTDGQQTLNNGVNQLLLPQSDAFTIIQAEYLNNGVPLNINTPDITNVALKYGGASYLVQEDWVSNMQRYWTLNGEKLIPVDGTVIFDQGIRRGNINRRDVHDAINDQQITDLTLEVTTNGSTSITNGQTLYVIEALQKVG